NKKISPQRRGPREEIGICKKLPGVFNDLRPGNRQISHLPLRTPCSQRTDSSSPESTLVSVVRIRSIRDASFAKMRFLSGAGRGAAVAQKGDGMQPGVRAKRL